MSTAPCVGVKYRIRRTGLAICPLLLLLGSSTALAQSPLVVWCFGDSITFLYAPVLASLNSDWEVHNYGLPCETTDQGLVRLKSLIAENPVPNVVVILEGANDIGHRLMGDPNFPNAPEGAARNVREMVAIVRAAGAVPITGLPVGTIKPSMMPAELRPYVLPFRRDYRALASLLRQEDPKVHFRLRYVDDFGALFPHQSDLGSLVMSRRVVVVINQLLRQGVITTSTNPTTTTTTTSCLADGSACTVDGDCCAAMCQAGVCGSASTTTSTLAP